MSEIRVARKNRFNLIKKNKIANSDNDQTNMSYVMGVNNTTNSYIGNEIELTEANEFKDTKEDEIIYKEGFYKLPLGKKQYELVKD